MSAQTIAGFSGDVLNGIDVNTEVASVMQVSTRNSSSKDRVSRALTELQRLKRSDKVTKTTSACRLDSGPLPDSATDIDVIGSPDLSRAKNVQPCVPLKYDTIAGGGVCKMRGDLSTSLVDLTAAPIIESSKVSIASMSTVHD